MPLNILLVFGLSFLLHLISTIGLSVRMVGTRTKKMAASYAVYNIVFLLARFTNTLQAPLLAKTIEKSIIAGESPNNQLFYTIILFSFLGTLVGILGIPTMQRFMFSAVEKAYQQNSILKLLLKSIHPKTFVLLKSCITVPSKANLSSFSKIRDMPLGIIGTNVIVSALITVSVLSCLYAGYLNPELRTTSLSLNGFIVGFSAVLFMIVVEPHVGIVADKVINEEYTEGYFRRYLIMVILARSLGTGLSALLLLPLSRFVVFLAEHLFI